MDRLSILRAGLAVISACAITIIGTGCNDNAAAPSRQRVVAVTADRPQGQDLAAFCDVHATGTGAKRLTFPPLDSPPTARSKNASWRWVNVWATWCRPCIEEMPMLLRWRDRLTQEGTPVELTFLSVDESVEVVDRFRKSHAGTPPSLRLSDHEALTTWLATLGLDPGATLPIQIYADSDDRVRCVRSGALNEEHLITVKRLLASR